MKILAELFAANRSISWRRLFAFLVATGLLVGGYITADAWSWITAAYIGGEVLTRITTRVTE